jgi:hypothetical protein
MYKENSFILPKSNLERLKQQQTNTLSRLLHDKWRQSLLQKEESRLEATKDKKWVAKNQTLEVDLVNTEYDDLPDDWQKESEASVRIAIDEIYKAQEVGQVLDNSFVERVSALIHTQWLERNSDSKFAYQDVPYEALSEEEKDKDRNFVKEAINFCS